MLVRFRQGAVALSWGLYAYRLGHVLALLDFKSQELGCRVLMCASADSAAELTHFSILCLHAETPGCPPDVCPNDPLFHDARWFAARLREQGQSEGVAPSLYTPHSLARSGSAAALLAWSSFGGGSLAWSSGGAPGALGLSWSSAAGVRCIGCSRRGSSVRSGGGAVKRRGNDMKQPRG